MGTYKNREEMSTDFPYAWGRPPWDSEPLEDVWEEAVSNTSDDLIKDLKDILREKLIDEVMDYIVCPSEWYDTIKEDEDNFVDQVIDDVISKLNLVNR